VINWPFEGSFTSFKMTSKTGILPVTTESVSLVEGNRLGSLFAMTAGDGCLPQSFVSRSSEFGVASWALSVGR